LPDQVSGMAASGQRRQGSASPSMASNDAVETVPSNIQLGSLPPAIFRIAEAWADLPPHIREAIQTLIDAVLLVGRDGRSFGVASARAPVVTDDGIHRMAQGCRTIIQSCLREEEWPDADHEFFEVIKAGLSAVI
jgi:hypothetical protein